MNVTVEGGIKSPLRGLDIGEETRRRFAEIIGRAATIAWNGPQGVFECEPFAGGTRAVLDAVREATKRGVPSVAGGGDTTAALGHFDALGLRFSRVYGRRSDAFCARQSPNACYRSANGRRAAQK